MKQVRELQQKLLSVQQEKESAVSKGTVEKELHHQVHVLMRDEKGRKKEARSNKQGKAT